MYQDSQLVYVELSQTVEMCQIDANNYSHGLRLDKQSKDAASRLNNRHPFLSRWFLGVVFSNRFRARCQMYLFVKVFVDRL
jgi:hypothetical protein